LSSEAKSCSDIQEIFHFNGTQGSIISITKPTSGPQRQLFAAIQYPHALFKIHINISSSLHTDLPWDPLLSPYLNKTFK
jgi:hypothetical protein